jgi:hypothetical protein
LTKTLHRYRTDEEFLEAVVDNIHDPEWRLKNLYTIINKKKQKVLYTPNFVQEKLIRNRSPYDAILKARQFGVSTHYIIEKLDRTLWGENQTSCIIAHEQDAIKKLFRIARNAYEHIHPAIKPGIGRGGGSLYEMYFPETNSRIYCDLEVRGDTINNLHISEMAFCKDPAKILATIDAVPLDGGNISIETTPNGLNHFYDSWNSVSWNFKRHFFPWYLHAEYQLPGLRITRTEEEKALAKKARKLFDHKLTDSQVRFRRFKISQRPGAAGKKHFMQEYPEDDVTCFLSSGGNVFDLVTLTEMINALKEPIFKDETVERWEEPIPYKLYVCGVDTAEGVGGDYSVATVYRADTREQVAQLRTNGLKPAEFAEKVYELCESFVVKRSGWPLLGVERNNHGHTVIQKLNDLCYPNLFEGHDKKDGWLTTKATRPLLLDEFIEDLEAELLTVNSRDTLDECLTLVNNEKGKIEAAEGKHDDTIIATAISVQLMKRAGLAFNNDIMKM